MQYTDTPMQIIMHVTRPGLDELATFLHEDASAELLSSCLCCQDHGSPNHLSSLQTHFLKLSQSGNVDLAQPYALTAQWFTCQFRGRS